MLDEIRFDDLTPAEVPVAIGGKTYVLREASGDAAVAYRNATMAGARIHESGTVLGSAADAEPILIAKCLFQRIEQPDGTIKERPVSVDIIRSWPSRVSRKLFDRAKLISGLGEQDESMDDLMKQKAEVERKLALLESDENPTSNLLGAMTGGSEYPTD